MTSYLNKQIIFLTFIAVFFLQSCKSNIDGNSLYTDTDSLLKYKSNHLLVTGTVVEYFSASHKKISSVINYKYGLIEGKWEYYTQTGEVFLDGVTIKKTFINLEKQLNTKEIDLWKEGAIRYNICEFKVQKKYNKQEAPINIETNKAISFINNQFDAQIDFLYIHYKDTLIKYPIK